MAIPNTVRVPVGETACRQSRYSRNKLLSLFPCLLTLAEVCLNWEESRVRRRNLPIWVKSAQEIENQGKELSCLPSPKSEKPPDQAAFSLQLTSDSPSALFANLNQLIPQVVAS